MATDWKDARKEFESTEISFGELAARHGLSPSTVRKRAGKEGWKKKLKALRPEEKGEGAEAGSRTDDVLSGHRSLWMGVKKRLVRGLESRDSKLGLEELKVAKIAGEVLTSVIKGERQAWGLEDGAEADTDMAGADEIARKMAEATVPSGADEAVERE